MTHPMALSLSQAQPVEAAAPRRFVFVLMPSFSPFDLASAVEALSAANNFDRIHRFDWRVINETGQPMQAANGLTVAVDGALSEVGRGDLVMVLGGSLTHGSDILFGWLRRAFRLGAWLGGIGGGTAILARAGVVSDRQVTTHWSLRSALIEQYPALHLSRSIFTVDRGLATCAGGAAVLDMMLHLITEGHGSEVGLAVADQLVCSAARSSQQDQTIAEHCRTGQRHEKLTEALSLMRREMEDPWSPSEIAAHVGLSTRQLERLFARYLNASPKVFYTRLRLENARALLQQTNMRIIDVAIASGFGSQTHFSKLYRRHYGIPPHQERGLS